MESIKALRRLSTGEWGLYLFAFGMYLNRVLAVAGCLLMLVEMIRERDRVMPALNHLALYRWLLALAVYVFLRCIAAMILEPEAAMEHGRDAVRLIYLLGVVLLAWHLQGSESRVQWALLLSAAGFFLARLAYLGWSLRMPEDWWEQRHGFGLEPIPLGFYAATILLGLLIFLPRLRVAVDSERRRAMLMALWVFLVGLSLLCVTLTQSRAAWLALWPGLLLLLVLAIARIARSGAPLLQKSLHVPLLVVAVLGAFWLGGTTLQERFDEERANIERLLNLDLDSVRSGNEAGADFSIGTRLNMLKSGWQTWLEKPVFGSGPAAAKRTLAVHPDPILRRWNDYHNAVINILVCYGAVGLTLALGGVLETARLAWVAVRERAYGADTLLFLVLALAILVFSLLSNFRLLNFDWRYTLFLVAGALASPRLAQLASTRPSPTLPDHIKSGPIVK